MWIKPPSADSTDTVVAPEVHVRVLQEGQARVIVEMRLPGGRFVVEGGLAETGRRAQQGNIAATRLQILSRLAARSHRELRQYSTVPFLSLEVGPDAIAELEASSNWVNRVVEDKLHAPSLPQSVPLIGADKAWSRGFDGTGMVVAVLDTGVQATHPFLAGKVVEEACFSHTGSGLVSLCPNGSSQQTGPGSGVNCSIPGTECWHGTHVAGIAAGDGTGAGVAFSGVAKGAKIMAVQVFTRVNSASDCGGSAPCVLAFTSDIMAALEHVYSLRGVWSFAAANLSLGLDASTTPCDDDPTKLIIDNLRSAGIATVIASGNDGYVNAIDAPACISSAISVSATTKADAVWPLSNVASFLSLFAPGDSILSSVAPGYPGSPPAQFGFASGTSMATPHVAGAWAILKQAAPSATVAQILSFLQTTGVLITDTGGLGVTKPRIQVDQALTVLLSGACVATATTLCLDNHPGDHRFAVTASFHTSQGGGSSGNAGAIPAAPLGVTQGGLFWFFESTNPELLVKILPKCSENSPHFLVFASAGTNVGVTITVTDTFTAAQKVYTNPDLTPMAPIQDITAFSCP
jgi:subtilisin